MRETRQEDRPGPGVESASGKEQARYCGKAPRRPSPPRTSGGRTACVRPRTPDDQASYLNESETFARYATTLPPSIFKSSLLTSATRRSRSDAAAVSTAVLAASSQEVALVPDYVVFEIPDAFVVGYGLDYQDAYRNLPYLAVLEEEDLAT